MDALKELRRQMIINTNKDGNITDTKTKDYCHKSLNETEYHIEIYELVRDYIETCRALSETDNHAVKIVLNNLKKDIEIKLMNYWIIKRGETNNE